MTGVIIFISRSKIFKSLRKKIVAPKETKKKQDLSLVNLKCDLNKI